MSKKREPRIYLDKEHGLAPMLTVCRICGEDTNEILLLGKEIHKLQDQNGKKYEYRGSSTEKMVSEGFCKRCEELLDEGSKAFICVDNRAVIVTKKAGQEILGDRYEDSPVYMMEVKDFDAIFSHVCSATKSEAG